MSFTDCCLLNAFYSGYHCARFSHGQWWSTGFLGHLFKGTDSAEGNTLPPPPPSRLFLPSVTLPAIVWPWGLKAGAKDGRAERWESISWILLERSKNPGSRQALGRVTVALRCLPSFIRENKLLNCLSHWKWICF